MRAGVLITGRPPDGLEGRFGSYGDMASRFISGVPGLEECRYYEALDGELPRDPGECDAWIITGSAASAYDDAQWIRDIAGFCLAAHGQGARLLGICFGHQLLAMCFGGRVEKSERGWGVGIHSYSVHSPAPWMKPAASEFSVIALHQDQVVEPPPGATIHAGNDFCPFGLMSIGERVLTIQTHPEMTSDYARELYDARKAVYGDETGERARRMLRTPHDHELVASWAAEFLAAKSIY
jgi:GMP synthase-like glutamine amidotransferase